MKSIREYTKELFGENEFETISVTVCPDCKIEIKTVRFKLIGGPRKGEYQTQTSECHCRLGKEALQAAQRAKISYFKRLWTINDSLKEATLENYQPTDETQELALLKAEEFLLRLQQKVKIVRMMLYGRSGLGKSHLSVAVCKKVEEMGLTSLFIELPTLKKLIQSTFNKEIDFSQLEIMKALEEVDVLVIDDLGAEGITEWSRELVFSIMNARLNKHLIITTNLTIPEINKEYGEKHLDRIIQGMRKDDVVKIQGKHSYRLKDFLSEKW